MTTHCINIHTTCTLTHSVVLSLLALMWSVSADGVVAHELGLGSCRRVLWCLIWCMHWWILCWRGGGWVAEGAGPSAEALRLSVTMWRIGSWRDRRINAHQVSCWIVASKDEKGSTWEWRQWPHNVMMIYAPLCSPQQKSLQYALSSFLMYCQCNETPHYLRVLWIMFSWTILVWQAKVSRWKKLFQNTFRKSKYIFL